MSTLRISADANALDVIAEEARVVAQFFGVDQCDIAAEMLVKRIANRLGNREVWLAGTRGRATTRSLHAHIRKAFNSRNPVEPIGDVIARLAVEGGISERQVRRIISARPQKSKEPAG
jgi:hypothetical protein